MHVPPTPATADASTTTETVRIDPPRTPLSAAFAAQARAFGAALHTGARGALFRPGTGQPPANDVVTLLLLITASLLRIWGEDLWHVGLDGQFYGASLPSLVFPHSLALLAIWLIGVPGRAMPAFLPTLVAVTAVQLVIDWVASLVFAALDSTHPAAWLAWRDHAIWLVNGWTWAATWCMVARVAHLSLRARVWAAVVLPLVWLGPGAWFAQDSALWVENLQERSDAVAAPQVTSEQVWARQPELLDEALAQVTPGRPGTTELFHIVMGTYGAQDVFVREARAAHAVLNQRFGAQGHGVLLANHPSSALDLPFANLTNLRDALATVAHQMNLDEDVLLLYITTHGSREHTLSVDLWPYQFDSIDGATLRAALDEAGIRYRVIVLSACYAGGLLPALQGPDTAVFTAAAADRTSFGCANGRDWTYFGEAFYTHGLARTTDLVQAFELARAHVTARETAEGQIPSQPQASVGDGIRSKLRALASRP